MRPTLYVGMLLLVLSSWPGVAGADDLEIYTGQLSGVKPNVLLIFDNSSSMEAAPSSTSSSSGSSWSGGSWYRDHRDGGSTGGTTSSDSKLEITREVLKYIVDKTDGVNFGLMAFVKDSGGNHGGRILEPCGASKARIKAAIDNIATSYYGSTGTPLGETLAEAGLYFAGKGSAYLAYWPTASKYGTTQTSIDENGASFFWYQSSKYVSPIAYPCQKNYIVFMTDGDPNDDGTMPSPYIIPSKAISAYGDSDGQTLDDVAAYLSDPNNDIYSGLAGMQHVKTYTVGFDIATAATLLNDAASRGGGKYYQASDKDQLFNAFNEVLAEALAEANATFAPPVVPRNPENQTDAGNKAYLSFFKTQANGRWIGNLKAYGLVNGVLMDDSAPSVQATGSDGTILDTAKSYWSTAADGLNVDYGGAGALLAARPLSGSGARSVYTYTGTQAALTHASNIFTAASANANLTPALFGVTTTTDRDTVITQTLAGIPVTHSDGTTIANWRLGDIVHSEPLVKNFEATYQNGVIDGGEAIKSYIFVGANDGMLHVFNAASGSEVWAFIPPGQLANLKKRVTFYGGTEHNYFVDGSPVIEAVQKSDGTTMQLLMFGERRGGQRYYALDVTNPDQPVWKYQLTETLLTNLDWDGTGGVDGVAATLGKSWSRPQFKKVRSGNLVKEVFLLAGGYDPERYDIPPATTNSIEEGRAIFTVQADTGSVFGLNINAGNWKSPTSPYAPYLTNAIVDVTGFDKGGYGYIDRIYAGDLGGNIIAARYNKCTNADCNNDSWEKIEPALFDLPATLTLPSGTTVNLGQKFMTRPEVALEPGKECVYLGTGDRENPLGTSFVNAIYAICNPWAASQPKPLSTGNLIDVTENLVQQGTAAQKATADAAIKGGYGWYIRLTNPGEKVISSPKLLNKKLYFTTYTPAINPAPCTPAYDYGTSRLYAVDYLTGAAVYNFNSDSQWTKEDRSIIIGTSIAAEPILTTTGATTSLFYSSGGKFGGMPVETSPLVKRYYWRQLK